MQEDENGDNEENGEAKSAAESKWAKLQVDAPKKEKHKEKDKGKNKVGKDKNKDKESKGKEKEQGKYKFPRYQVTYLLTGQSKLKSIIKAPKAEGMEVRLCGIVTLNLTFRTGINERVLCKKGSLGRHRDAERARSRVSSGSEAEGIPPPPPPNYAIGDILSAVLMSPKTKGCHSEICA